MKKICSLLIVLLFALPAISQQREYREKRERKDRIEQKKNHLKDLTADQIAILHTKKMAIALDLNEGQKRELLKLNKELASERKERRDLLKKKRENGEQPTKEERFEHANERLDKQYEVLQKMKKILNKDQFEEWRKHKKRRKGHHLKRRKK